MEVIDKTERGVSYFSAIEDGREIGEVNYYESPGKITITHVGVNPEFRGCGKGLELVMNIVNYARENDLKITPVCSYARHVFDKNPDIHDVLYKGF